MDILARCGTIGAMPPATQALFDDPGGKHLFTSRPWFETFVAAGLARGAEPLFLALGDDAAPHAVLPCEQPAGAGRRLNALTSFYSCDFRPLFAPGMDPAITALALARATIREFAGYPIVGFDSLDVAQPGVASFLSGLSRPGRVLLRYDHFGRWWEDVSEKSFDEYMSERGGALREVVRRKGQKLARDGATFEMIGPGDGPEAVERGIADYEAVYAASWKEPEPFPDFQPTLIRKLAVAGWLRLALCRVNGKPVAAQLWTFVAGTATVLKLAHDQAFDRDSPGTMLTHFAIGRLMDAQTVRTLDFGRGDDPYKAGWTTNRTQHIGILSVDIAKRPLMVARHLLGALIRRLRSNDYRRETRR